MTIMHRHWVLCSLLCRHLAVNQCHSKLFFFRQKLKHFSVIRAQNRVIKTLFTEALDISHRLYISNTEKLRC